LTQLAITFLSESQRLDSGLRVPETPNALESNSRCVGSEVTDGAPYWLEWIAIRFRTMLRRLLRGLHTQLARQILVPVSEIVRLNMEWTREQFVVTCDPARQDRKLIADFLATSYWAKGISPEIVEKSLAGSICFSLRDGDRQVGFARVISDCATIAYLGDVFVLPAYRGIGLGTWLMQCVVSHPELQGLRRWILATRDAHGLYERFGFTALKSPGVFMERHDPDVYAASGGKE
jgi:GNAT superfamily N-acetyltransferase